MISYVFEQSFSGWRVLWRNYHRVGLLLQSFEVSSNDLISYNKYLARLWGRIWWCLSRSIGSIKFTLGKSLSLWRSWNKSWLKEKPNWSCSGIHMLILSKISSIHRNGEHHSRCDVGDLGGRVGADPKWWWKSKICFNFSLFFIHCCSFLFCFYSSLVETPLVVFSIVSYAFFILFSRTYGCFLWGDFDISLFT